MTRFFQLLVDGVATGAAYSLFAVGFTLVFGVNRILNLAHGAIFMAGAMIAVLLVDRSGLPFVPAMLIAMLAAGALNVALDLVAFRQLARRQAPEFAAVVASIGAILIITNIAQRVSHTTVQRFPEGAFPASVVDVFGIQLTLIRLVIVLVAAVLTGGVILYLRSTVYGKQLRATAVSEATSSLLGINPGAVRFQAFFISGALAGAGGVLIGVAFNNVHFAMGDLYLLYGLVAIVFGGMGSVGGALVAGIVIGIVQSFTVGYLSSQLSDAVPFVLLALILLVRPSGLFTVFTSERRVGESIGMTQWWMSNKPLIEAILINIGLAFSQYVVLRAGVFSVATIGLAGIGGYTAGLCSLRLGLPYPVCLLGGVVMATGVSLLLGWPLSRLRGIFQAVATLAFVLVLQTMMLDLTGLTGGSFGLNGIPREVQTWHLVLAVLVMAFLLVNLGRTRPGRAFDAIGGDETAAVTHGISVQRYQFMAFGLSGLFAGLAGGLLAFQNFSVEPTQFGFAPTIDVLIYVVLGGTLSVAGPIVGTTVFMGLPEIARPFAANRDIIVGAILIFVVIYLPDGLVDSPRRMLRERRARRARERSEAHDVVPGALGRPPTTTLAVEDHAEA